MRLKDKVAIITGGGSGIGRAISLSFAREGAKVVLAARGLERLEKTKEAIEALGSEALAIKTDVTVSQDINDMVKKTINRFGKIDILVNNSGIYPMGPFLEETEEEIDRVFDVNLKGVFLCTQAVAREMVKQKKGKIISIASGQGRIGVPMYAHYSASKGGIISATRAWASELSPLGINVNAISPGLILTESVESSVLPTEYKEMMKGITPLRRLAVDEDVAGAAVFLASEESDFITSQIISVDGGVTSP
jgi:NAD(P)-dependent dehydrogenase (short-subunit alcohol dehydrogenase family)